MVFPIRYSLRILRANMMADMTEMRNPLQERNASKDWGWAANKQGCPARHLRGTGALRNLRTGSYRNVSNGSMATGESMCWIYLL